MCVFASENDVKINGIASNALQKDTGAQHSKHTVLYRKRMVVEFYTENAVQVDGKKQYRL